MLLEVMFHSNKKTGNEKEEMNPKTLNLRQLREIDPTGNAENYQSMAEQENLKF